MAGYPAYRNSLGGLREFAREPGAANPHCRGAANPIPSGPGTKPSRSNPKRSLNRASAAPELGANSGRQPAGDARSSVNIFRPGFAAARIAIGRCEPRARRGRLDVAPGQRAHGSWILQQFWTRPWCLSWPSGPGGNQAFAMRTMNSFHRRAKVPTPAQVQINGMGVLPRPTSSVIPNPE